MKLVAYGLGYADGRVRCLGRLDRAHLSVDESPQRRKTAGDLRDMSLLLKAEEWPIRSRTERLHAEWPHACAGDLDSEREANR